MKKQQIEVGDELLCINDLIWNRICLKKNNIYEVTEILEYKKDNCVVDYNYRFKGENRYNPIFYDISYFESYFDIKRFERAKKLKSLKEYGKTSV